jgi:flagellar biosynthesis GTPase FlhF
MKKYILLMLILPFAAASAWSQEDRQDVRKGNRDYRKGNWREAEIDYRKALVKDSMSVAATYNLASTLYREGDPAQAQKVLEGRKDVAATSADAADYFYNLGDMALANKDYQTAVNAFKESLLLNPADLNAKENYIYAKKKLEDQQQNQQNQNDQNQQDDKNKDQDKKDDQKENEEQQPPKQQPQDKPDNNKQDQQQEPKISPQAAQQMLQAIQEKEKETQEKVKKEKAKALNSRQKEKNW